MKIFCRDIKDIDEFKRKEYSYKRIINRPDLNKYVYECRFEDKVIGYEVMRGKSYTQPDGTKIKVMPGDEDFGVYGFYIDNNCYAQRFINWLMESDNWTPDARHNFKKSLKN